MLRGMTGSYARLGLLLLGACTGGEGVDDGLGSTGILPPPSDSTGEASSGGTTGSSGATTLVVDGSSSSSSEGGDPCLFCDAPNQQCIEDQCVTTCQGQLPDPCGPAQVCDVMSGECRDPATPCTVAGDSEPCDGRQCGPGTVCDGQGACIPVAPCGDVACLPLESFDAGAHPHGWDRPGFDDADWARAHEIVPVHTGSQTVKRVPRPGALSTSMAP